MSDYKIGDVVIFGREQGEKTLGTVVKVNRKTVKVRQEESRGMQKSHKIGKVWGVPILPEFLRHATEAEVARRMDLVRPRTAHGAPVKFGLRHLGDGTEVWALVPAQAAPVKSQVPPRKPSARPPVGIGSGLHVKAEDLDVVNADPDWPELRLFVNTSVAINLAMTADKFAALSDKERAEAVAPFVIQRIEAEPYSAIEEIA